MGVIEHAILQTYSKIEYRLIVWCETSRSSSNCPCIWVSFFPDKSKDHVKQVTRHHIPINSYELLLKHVKTYIWNYIFLLYNNGFHPLLVTKHCKYQYFWQFLKQKSLPHEGPFCKTNTKSRLYTFPETPCSISFQEVHQALQGHLAAVSEAKDHMSKALQYLEGTKPGQGGYSQVGTLGMMKDMPKACFGWWDDVRYILF